jgi:starvation-inducible outer membrane lipoprotein
MKNIYKSTLKAVAILLIMTGALILPACNDNPDAYKTTDGLPTVSYVRIPDALSSDSLITHAFMNTTVALVGENLTSVKQIRY